MIEKSDKPVRGASRSKITWLAIGGTCLAALLWVYVTSMDATAKPSKTLPLSESSRLGNKSNQEPLMNYRAPVISSGYKALLSSRRLDPRVVTSINNGVFSIMRRGSLRSDADALSFVTSLLHASDSGDAVASYEIFLSTRECAAFMLPNATSADAEAAERFQACESLLVDQELMEGDWLTRAAQQGSIEAMLMYGVNPEYTLGGRSTYLKDPERVSEWKARAAQYLEDAAASGSHDALLSLSRAHSNGVIVREDPVRAFAYALAAYKTHPLPYMSDLIEQHRSELSWRQQSQGRRLAEEIVRGCCQKQSGDKP